MQRKLARRLGRLSSAACEALEARQMLTAAYLDTIGVTALQAALGAAMPTGAGISVAQIEHREQSIRGYAPDTQSSDFAGKSITLKSGSSIDSLHATRVGQHWYGSTNGVSPGVTQIASWEVQDWASELLNQGTTLPPAVETARVQNHSWNGSTGSVTDDVETLRRLDYMIQRDNTFVAIAIGNQGTEVVPRLLNASYNGVSVGLSNGTANYGQTSIDGVGRTKPEIVAPEGATSQATPQVSGSATLLIDTAQHQAWSAIAKANAQESETLKAILLAGAAKAPFPSWTNTPQRPLDPLYGAGQLNVYDSYYILTSGEQAPGAVGLKGWDFGDTATNGSNRTYTFTVPTGSSVPEFSIALTWNRIVTSTLAGGFGNLTSSLANLDLQLNRVGGSGTTTVAASTSTVDNVEYLYFKNLPAGTYQVVVTADQPQMPYALAWGGGTNLGTVASSFAGSQLFYNDSAFDGNNPAGGAADDDAVATDKTPLLAGSGAATFANYSSYSRGINGLMIDVAHLPGIPSFADVDLRVGNSNTPSQWSPAPLPQSVLIRFGKGVGGSDRVEVIWADNVIENQWLQVTLKATANTGLTTPVVFYYGNAIADSGNSATRTEVNAADEIAARNNPKTYLDPAEITNPYDYDRDGLVNATDQILARSNSNTLSTALRLISIPASLSAESIAASQPVAAIAAQQLATAQPSASLAATSAPSLAMGALPKSFAPTPVFDEQRILILADLLKDSLPVGRRGAAFSEAIYERIATNLVASRFAAI